MSFSEIIGSVIVGGILFYFFFVNGGFNPTNSGLSHSFMFNKYEVICKSIEHNTCGVSLSDCDNGMIYEYMQNLELKEIRNEDKNK